MTARPPVASGQEAVGMPRWLALLMVGVGACSEHGYQAVEAKDDTAVEPDNNSGFDLPGYCFEAEDATRLELGEDATSTASEPGAWCRLTSFPRTDEGFATEFDASGMTFSDVLVVGVFGSEFPGATTKIRVVGEVATPTDLDKHFYPVVGNFYTDNFYPVEGGLVGLDPNVSWFASAATSAELGAINDCTGYDCLWGTITTEIRDSSVETDADCLKYLRSVTCLIEEEEGEADDASKSAHSEPKNGCVPGRGTFALAPTGRIDKASGRPVAQPILVRGSGFTGASRLRSVTLLGGGAPEVVALDRLPLADASRRGWLPPSLGRRLSLIESGPLPTDAPALTGYTRFLTQSTTAWSWQESLAELAWDCQASEADARVEGRGRRFTLPMARLGCAVDVAQELTIELADGGRDAFVSLSGLEDRAVHLQLLGGSERGAFDLSRSGLRVRGEFVMAADGQAPTLALKELTVGGVSLCSVGDFPLDGP